MGLDLDVQGQQFLPSSHCQLLSFMFCSIAVANYVKAASLHFACLAQLQHKLISDDV